MSVDTFTPANEPVEKEIHNELLERLQKADEDPKPLAHFVRQWRWLGIPDDELVELQLIAPTAPDEQRADELRKKNRLNASLGEFRPANRYARAEGLKEALRLLRHAAENHQAQGLYIIPSRLKPAVGSKAQRNAWLQAAQGSGTTDHDIERRRVLMFDVDPQRDGGVKDISASPDERNRAVSRAIDLYADLTDILGGESSLALVSSGNGAQVHLRVDLDASKETTGLVARFLKVLDVLYSTETEEIDTAVSDPKRLFPAAGTLKKKGLNDEASGRVHRIITFVAGDDVPTVLDLDQVNGLLETLEGRLNPEQKERLDPKKTPTTTTKTKGDRASARQADWDAFWAGVEAVSVADVMAWLGTEGTCPGCGSTTGADDLTETKNVPVWKCLHNTCAAKGNGAGSYNTRHLVIEAKRDEVEDRTRSRGKDPSDPKALMTTAAMMIAEQFHIEVPKGGKRDPKPLIEALDVAAALDSDETMEVLQAIATLDTAVEREAHVGALKSKLNLKATQVRSVVSTIGTMRRASKAAKPDDEPEASDHEPFVRGDHVEIAERLQERHPGMVFTEGAFWEFASNTWKEVAQSTLSKEVQSMAGARVGDSGRLGINHSTVKGSIACLTDRVTDPGFFAARPGLVNFRNGVLKVSPKGEIELLQHSAEHRCRFGYEDVDWDPNVVSTRLLKACGEWFRGDSDRGDKTRALLEHFGLTLLGYAPSFARGAIYYGPGANNGKSTAAAVFRGCIPQKYVSALSPQQLGEKFKVAELAGKRANIMDDLPTKTVMESEILKTVITGKNPIPAERKNKDPFDFIAEAGWLVCGNTLPRSDDATEGYFRRWLVLTFSRVFTPSDEKKAIEDFILDERAQIIPMVIRVAAQALARGGYTIPASHDVIMKGWREGEPVRGFVASLCEQVPVGQGDTRERLYEAFREFSNRNGFGAMNANTFAQRLDNIGLRKHTERGNVFLVRLRRPEVEDLERADAENDQLVREVIDPAWTLYDVVQQGDTLWARRQGDAAGRLYALADDTAAIEVLWARRVESASGETTYPPIRGLVGIGSGGRPFLFGWSAVEEPLAS